VPLIMQEHVIGSMELLDKVGAESFSPADIQTLGSFANQAGVAIELGRTYRHIGPLLSDVLQSAGGVPLQRQEALRQRSATFAIRIEQEPTYLATLELATLVQEIAWEGEEEREAIIGILNAFARYLRARPDPFRDAARP
jgi:GAF domain-containing protein